MHGKIPQDLSDDDGLYDSLEVLFFFGSLEYFFLAGKWLFLWVKVVC